MLLSLRQQRWTRRKVRTIHPSQQLIEHASDRVRRWGSHRLGRGNVRLGGTARWWTWLGRNRASQSGPLDGERVNPVSGRWYVPSAVRTHSGTSDSGWYVPTLVPELGVFPVGTYPAWYRNRWYVPARSWYGTNRNRWYVPMVGTGMGTVVRFPVPPDENSEARPARVGGEARPARRRFIFLTKFTSLRVGGEG